MSFRRTQLNEIYDFIVDYSIATHKEIELVAHINGYNLKALNDIIEVRTGYHDMDQYLECEDL
tara:strand:- start:281 stop:469 length:189 start_codon:yes stop_codon:yes gene_type:complete